MKLNCILVLGMASMMLACGNKAQSEASVADTTAVDSVADTTRVAEAPADTVNVEKMITDIVNEIYSKEPGTSFEDIIKKYGSESFKKALKTCDANTPAGELGPIDCDFFIQGQDWDEKFSAKVLSVTVKDDDEAEAKVKIHNGESSTIRLLFVKDKDTYLLDNVIVKYSNIKKLMTSN